MRNCYLAFVANKLVLMKPVSIQLNQDNSTEKNTTEKKKRKIR